MDKENQYKIILKKYPKKESSLLISLLQETQALYGYLPQDRIKNIAEHLNVPFSKIYGVITFYSQFYLEPTGKYIIKVCAGTACHVNNAPGILEAISNELKIKHGETTKDYKFSLEVVYCLGTCFLAPVILINDKYYGKLTADKIKGIIKSYENL